MRDESCEHGTRRGRGAVVGCGTVVEERGLEITDLSFLSVRTSDGRRLLSLRTNFTEKKKQEVSSVRFITFVIGKEWHSQEDNGCLGS